MRTYGWILLFSIFIITTNTGCGTSDPNRGPNSFGIDDRSNAHPAAYLTDRFPVNRPLPKHKPGPQTEFYFKKCNMAGDNWPISHTSYECSYP